MADVPSDPLISLITVAAEHLGYSCRATEADEVRLMGPRGDGPHILRLHDLRRRLNELPFDQWPALITDHVGTFLAHVDMEYSDPLHTNEFAVVRSLLRTRFAPADTAPGIDTIARSIAPGIIQVAVINNLLTAEPVTPALLAHWEIDAAELFDLAEANTRADRLDIEWRGYNDAYFAILTGSDCASTHPKWLGDYPVIGTHGALFVTSHEGNVYAHPIAGPHALTAMMLLGKVAANTYRNEPRPISPAVYWWNDGEISLAAATRIDDDDNVEVRPTPEFETLLTSLAVTCEFAVVSAGAVDSALDALERYQQMCDYPNHSVAPPAVDDLVAEINRNGGAVGFVATVADSRGAVLRTWGPNREQHLLAVLKLTKDRDLAVLDVETGHLYDPRGHVDVRVSVGDGRTIPYLTTALLEDFVVAAADPDDPFVVVSRADETYIQTRRHEWVYEIEHRAGSAADHFRVYTLQHTVVRDVIWAWACGDPSWTAAVPWRHVDPESPGIEAASGLEILQDELSSMNSVMTPDTRALLDTFLAVRDTPISAPDLTSWMDLEIDPSVLRDLTSAHTAEALPTAEAETAETVETSNEPDEEP
ncbi:hypothetical protein ACQP1G_41715 [Nocardia sp. CA-107356]|uniref:hypothetical protein n=1 Tax=Nocardia sp. CA-107356 TaxID=3239972 RepID=UPI003D93317E